MTPADSHVYTLHRYYLWSTMLQHHFEESLGTTWFEGDEGSKLWTDDGIRGYAYLSYWYAALYVVVEGWHRLGLQDERVDELLASSNTKYLKRYRHSVFHFHEDYFNEPLILPLIGSDDSPVTWVRSLSSELGRWFLTWLEGLKQHPEP